MKEKTDDLTLREQLKSVLMKKAFGYDVQETVEEYVSGDDGDVKLSKRKVTVKPVPPDVTALKLLISGGEEKELSEYTDEELETEKDRLINMLYLNEKNLKKKEKKQVAKKKD